MTLRGHPAVAWVERQNSGAYKDGVRFIRYGWPGCSDILGQLKDGRFLAVEVKAPKGRLRPEQALFLKQVLAAGGVAFVARNAADVLREIGTEIGTEIGQGRGYLSMTQSRPNKAQETPHDSGRAATAPCRL